MNNFSNMLAASVALTCLITDANAQAYVCQLPNKSRIVQSSPCSGDSKPLSAIDSQQPQISSGGDNETLRLKQRRESACRGHETAKLDYRFAQNNYTDNNAIQSAARRVHATEQECETATQALLNKIDPEKGAQFQRARSDRDQQNRIADMERRTVSAEANAAAANEEARAANQQSADARRQAEHARLEAAQAAQAAQAADAAASSAAAAAANRRPPDCYQRAGRIYCN